MSEYAPDAIRALFDQVKAAIPSAQLAGIIGDSNHDYGYHRGRNYVGGDDYSVQLPADQGGDGEAACGLDISWSNAADHYTVSQRLLNAAYDARMDAVREFYGSIDGWNVCGWDYAGDYAVTSDDSHLWHIHLSILRSSANDSAALSQVGAVITAGGSPVPPPSGGSRPWPSYMPADEYFGLITGPNESHGGYYEHEQPDVLAIQNKINELGFNAGYADGLYEQQTTDGVSRWQAALFPQFTSRYGEVWADDWGRLFP